MAQYLRTIEAVLAAPATTGNNTHTGVEYKPPGDGGYSFVGFQFVIEVAGATPTVTFQWQGSFDNLTYDPCTYFLTNTAINTVASEVLGTAIVQTAVGSYRSHLAFPNIRGWRFFRCVTSANTNITYRASMFYPSF
jgi:hypothetical protein